MKNYYLITEHNPVDWNNTNTILRLGGVHLSTMLGEDVLRKFIIRAPAGEDLSFIRLSLGDVEIIPIGEKQYKFLQTAGYIK